MLTKNLRLRGRCTIKCCGSLARPVSPMSALWDLRRMTEQFVHWKGEAAKFEEWYDITSEYSSQNVVSQIQLMNPSVSLWLDLLSVTRMVDEGRLMEVLGSGDRVVVPLDSPRWGEMKSHPRGRTTARGRRLKD